MLAMLDFMSRDRSYNAPRDTATSTAMMIPLSVVFQQRGLLLPHAKRTQLCRGLAACGVRCGFLKITLPGSEVTWGAGRSAQRDASRRVARTVSDPADVMVRLYTWPRQRPHSYQFATVHPHLLIPVLNGRNAA
jgi:hypothetical protein